MSVYDRTKNASPSLLTSLLERRAETSNDPRPRHIGIRAFRELEYLGRNDIKNMHAH